MYDYSKLKGKIIEVCGTQGEFAKRMDISNKSVTNKLNGKCFWKQLEIEKALEVLHLDKTEIQPYFFYIRSSILNELLTNQPNV